MDGCVGSMEGSKESVGKQLSRDSGIDPQNSPSWGHIGVHSRGPKIVRGARKGDGQTTETGRTGGGANDGKRADRRTNGKRADAQNNRKRVRLF